MIDRLRAMLNRPVGEQGTGLVFAVCVLVIVLGAIALSRLGSVDAPRHPGAAVPAERDWRKGYEVTNPPVVSHYPRRDLPGVHAPDFAAEREATVQVRRATRRFLETYLAFTYRHAPASAIESATPELVARLASHPPRVPTEVRRRRPRVRLVRDDGIDRQRAAAVGTVDDGVVVYFVRIRLRRAGARAWVVTEIRG